MAPLYLCTEDLRFTQKSIRNTFNEAHGYQRIDDAVDQIGRKQLTPEVFMPLHVVLHRNVLWSLEGRRLWVLRKAGVPVVRVLVRLPTYNTRMENFFARLNNPFLLRRYSSANYFPFVRGGVREVGIDLNIGVPPPLIPLQLNRPARVNAGVAQANRAPPLPRPQPQPQPQPPPPPQLRSITVRSNTNPLVFPLPNASDQTPKAAGPGGTGKKGSDWLWERILNVVDRIMDPSKAKLVLVLVLCFVLCQAHNIWKGGVNGKLEIAETITVNEEAGKNVFRGGSRENALSYQKILGVSGYLGVMAVKGAVGLGKILCRLFVSIFGFVLRQASVLLQIFIVRGVVGMGKILSKMFCFLRFVVPNVVDLIRRLVVSSGRMTLDAFGVILNECFSHLHSVLGQIAVGFGRIGICVSDFCLEKFWELLNFIKHQALGQPSQMVVWSQVKMQDALRFYLKEFLCKVVWSAR